MKKNFALLAGFFLIAWALAGLIGCGGGGDSPGIFFPTPSVSPPTTAISGNIDITGPDMALVWASFAKGLTVRDGPAIGSNILGTATVNMADPSTLSYTVDIPTPTTGDQTVYFKIMGGATTVSNTTILQNETAKTYDFSASALPTTTVTGTLASYTVNGGAGDFAHDAGAGFILSTALSSTYIADGIGGGLNNPSSNNLTGTVFRPDSSVTVYLYPQFLVASPIDSFTLTNSDTAKDVGSVTWPRSAIKISGSINNHSALGGSSLTILASTSSSFDGSGERNVYGMATESNNGSYYINIEVPSGLPKTIYLYTLQISGMAIGYISLGNVTIPAGTTAGTTINKDLTVPATP
jgi:hypothetical protein